ncbi:hypothetical protein D3C80_1796460 [compost metagenome]
MQRAGIQEYPRAGHQRGQQADRQAKSMEQRQRRHKAVTRREVSHGTDLLNVRQQAGVGMHHPFRIAF